jgi:hypothetical protein
VFPTHVLSLINPNNFKNPKNLNNSNNPKNFNDSNNPTNPKNMCCSVIAMDGTFVYTHTPSGLRRVGTGRNGSIPGFVSRLSRSGL